MVGGQDGARLRALRGQRGLSLAQLAGQAGLSKGELSKLETGVRPVRPDHVLRLARALAVPPQDLLGPDSPLQALLQERPQPAATLPLYDGRDLVRDGDSARPTGSIAAPEPLRGVPGAYAVVINDLSNAPALAPGMVLHVDPSRVASVGDLVINRVGWSPLAFYLRQDDDGHFYGLTLSRKRVDLALEDIERLHKVAGVWFVG